MGRGLEVELFEGFLSKAPPLFAVDAPVLGFVEERTGVWWAGEVVGRSMAGVLGVGAEMGKDLELGGEAGEHAAFAAGYFRGEGEGVKRAGVGKELAGLKPGGLMVRGTVVVRGELHQQRDGKAVATKEVDGGLDAERSGVMVGVAAFVGVREDDFGLEVGEYGAEKTSESTKVEGGFLIDSADLEERSRRDAGDGKCGFEFTAAPGSILFAAGNSPGGSIGGVEDEEAGQSMELAAQPEDFVIGVSGHDQIGRRGDHCTSLCGMFWCCGF